MTHEQKRITKEWVFIVLIGACSFLAGTNLTGWALDNKVSAHKLNESAHPVIKNELRYMENRETILESKHESDILRIENKIDMKFDELLREIRELKEK